MSGFPFFIVVEVVSPFARLVLPSYKVAGENFGIDRSAIAIERKHSAIDGVTDAFALNTANWAIV
jgi:hypothetical protein